jgi:hypothetical protein
MREMPQKHFNLSVLDRPDILRFIFYPRPNLYPRPRVSNAQDHLIEVEEGIRIGCRFYTAGKDFPTLLYFHGNGENIEDYDCIAPFYNQIKLNLFVADFRGYGLSGGSPTVVSTIRDANSIFKEFVKIVEAKGYKRALFVMGRSLGSAPAIELALHYQRELKGIIIESGFANGFRLLACLGVRVKAPTRLEEEYFSNEEKIKSVHIPTLAIHGEYDHLIPFSEGRKLYENAAATEKGFLLIPKGDHNDLMLVGKEQYFNKIKEFVRDVLKS